MGGVDSPPPGIWRTYPTPQGLCGVRTHLFISTPSRRLRGDKALGQSPGIAIQSFDVIPKHTCNLFHRQHRFAETRIISILSAVIDGCGRRAYYRAFSAAVENP